MHHLKSSHPSQESSHACAALQGRIVPMTWFERPTAVVAADLIGMVLCRRLSDARVLRARIVETEAYLGLEDPACHSYGNRRTARTEVLFGAGGHWYVYLTYGMHDMLNVVTGAKEQPEAVLIRAASLESIDHQAITDQDPRALAGPAKLSKALGVDRSFSGQRMVPESRLWLECDHAFRPHNQPAVQVAARVGIDSAGEAKRWLLRYCWQDHVALSKPCHAVKTSVITKKRHY